MEEILAVYLARLSNKKGLKKSTLNMNLAKKYSYDEREKALKSGINDGLIVTTLLPRIETKTKKTATIFSITTKGEKSLQKYNCSVKEKWNEID
jgi:hypothetical protein